MFRYKTHSFVPNYTQINAFHVDDGETTATAGSASANVAETAVAATANASCGSAERTGNGKTAQGLANFQCGEGTLPSSAGNAGARIRKETG